MTFRNAFNFEDSGVGSQVGFDGMVLEISVNGAPFQDIIAAGGSFATGGYNKTISGGTGSPIAGRAAWSGLSGGTAAVPAYITTTVNLPASANGQLVKFRWLVASDSSNVAAGDQGARIDTITGTACGTTAANVSISGRVLTNLGQGVANAMVVITDSNGVAQMARTGSFGYYQLDGILAGRTYVLRVDSRHFTFAPMIISLEDNLTDVDFISQ